MKFTNIFLKTYSAHKNVMGFQVKKKIYSKEQVTVCMLRFVSFVSCFFCLSGFFCLFLKRFVFCWLDLFQFIISTQFISTQFKWNQRKSTQFNSILFNPIQFNSFPLNSIQKDLCIYRRMSWLCHKGSFVQCKSALGWPFPPLVLDELWWDTWQADRNGSWHQDTSRSSPLSWCSVFALWKYKAWNKRLSVILYHVILILFEYNKLL